MLGPRTWRSLTITRRADGQPGQSPCRLCYDPMEDQTEWQIEWQMALARAS